MYKKFKKNKKFRNIFLIGLVLVMGAVFLGFAYNSGKEKLNEPVVQWVSHTEYWSSSGPGEDARASTIVRITDYLGNPFPVDECRANIYYPDKTLYVDNGILLPSGPAGNWYRTDPIPDVEGHYEQEVTCTFSGGRSITTSQSFHVNPALNFIKVVKEGIDLTREDISQTNLSLSANIENVRSELSSQLNITESNLENLLEVLGIDLNQKIEESQANLSTQLTDINLEIQAFVESTGEMINFEINQATTNITDLINSVNEELQEQLSALDLSLDEVLSDLEVNIGGFIENSTTEIIASVEQSEENIVNILTILENNLSSQLNELGLDLTTLLTNVRVDIISQIEDSEEVIMTRLNGLSGDLSSLIEETSFAILDYLQDYLPQLNESITLVSENTQWIIENAMNQDDKEEIIERFDLIDNNMAELIDMCGTEITNSSALCQEIYSMSNILNLLREENEQFYEELEQTTANIWGLLSGQIAMNIDQILIQLNIIQRTTEDINATVNAIRQDQMDRINIHILS